MKIVIAGGQAGTRRAVSLYLRTRLGVEVVGETGDLEVLMKLVKANQPDLIILDTELPSLQLSTLIPTLGRLDCPPAVSLLTFNALRAAMPLYIKATIRKNCCSPFKTFNLDARDKSLCR